MIANLVIAAVEMSFPGVLSKARQREVRNVSFNYAKVGVIFYISCWVIFHSTYSNQRLTFIDIFPLRRVYSTPVAGHIHGLSKKLFASILRLGCVVILPSKFLGLWNLRVLHRQNQQRANVKEIEETFGRMTAKESPTAIRPHALILVLWSLCWWSRSMGSKGRSQIIP